MRLGPILRRVDHQYNEIELLILVTPQIVEAMDPQGEEYGDDRFYAFVKEHARMRSRDIVQAAIKDLDAHKGEAEQHDDITIVTFRVLA